MFNIETLADILLVLPISIFSTSITLFQITGIAMDHHFITSFLWTRLLIFIVVRGILTPTSSHILQSYETLGLMYYTMLY